MNKQNLVIDIDDTLLKCDILDGKYCNPRPIKEEVEILKELKNTYVIILHTGRHWNHYQTTVQQLKELDIPYDELVMGKPLGIYVDRDSKKSLKELIDKA